MAADPMARAVYALAEDLHLPVPAVLAMSVEEMDGWIAWRAWKRRNRKG